MRISSITICVLLTPLAAAAVELAAPVAILVGDKPIDVELFGHAAPFVADFDRDGVKDLLVGEFYKGRLRIYRNIGSNREPRFDGFTLFQDGDLSGCVHSSCCMGFGPQMVDLDGDNHRDIISGNWIWQIILFRGLADHSYAPGEPITDRQGRPIQVGYGVSAFACDWDNDGDQDVLAGTVEQDPEQGNVFIVPNQGSADQFAFGKPEKLLADGEPILSTDGGAAPVAADWDGDGRSDLILGCGDGSVRWYRNKGTQQVPQLTSYVNLVDPPVKGEDRGLCSKPCVVDWNEDGHVDLVVGDAGEQFEKQLSAEEEEWRNEAKDQQTAYLKKWTEVFAQYRELMSSVSELPEDARDEHDLELAAARKELNRLSTVRTRFFELERSLAPGTQRHGRVWLLLNRGGEPTPVVTN